MTYDLDFRFRRAIDPEGLTMLATATQAIVDAMRDARNAGVSTEHDPAVRLLARHLGRIANGEDIFVKRAEDADLRAACFERIAQLANRPAMVTLARRGVAWDQPAKEAFHTEVRRALRRLASHLGLSRDDYSLATTMHDASQPGETTLHGDNLFMMVTTSGYMGQGEILYRRCRSKSDHFGGPNHHADINSLVDCERFAVKIARKLELSLPEPQERLDLPIPAAASD